MGPKTDAAIRAYQQGAGLVVDGRATPQLAEVLGRTRPESPAGLTSL